MSIIMNIATGSWSGPSAVKITGSGNVEDNLIALKALNMDKMTD